MAEKTEAQAYQPEQQVLKNYADIFVRFALNKRKGVQPGDVVEVSCPDVAKPLLLQLQESILEADGNLLLDYQPTGLLRPFYEKATDAQLEFSNEAYQRARAAMIDHNIAIYAEVDMRELEGIPAEKRRLRGRAWDPYYDVIDQKEREGKYSWTLGIYGTEAKAKEAGMSLEDYWNQIIFACFLDKPDPIGEWKHVFGQNQRMKEALDALDIDQLHVEADDIDLRLTVGEQRKWLGGTGRNIPSFEVFVSPDWRGTNGTIHFNQPLYRNGSLMNGITLEFKDGVVVNAAAEQNEASLQEMIARPNANRVGEFSLTDRRFSRITRFMADTLYDENIGGRYGNTHIALGSAYADSYTGDQSSMIPEDFEKLGFNANCAVHTDIVSTTDRQVTATLRDGTDMVIYRDGQFTV